MLLFEWNKMDSEKDDDLNLLDHLPGIVKYRNCKLVVKYGGNAMVDEKAQETVAKDLAFMHITGMSPIVIHGGGPAISEHMMRVGIEPQFIQGQRMTNEETLEIVEMVLCGKVNNQLVKQLNSQGACAIGLSGKDGGLIQARKHLREVMKDGKIVSLDLGQVGEVESVDESIIETLMQKDLVPVIAPIGVGINGEDYNINADILASDIAIAIKADKLIYLTDVDGIFIDPDDPSTLLEMIDVLEARSMMNKEIKGGMIPKVESCIKAIDSGVNSAHIINGMKEHSLLKTLLLTGEGTMIKPGL
jgi:acetylglutamate kinase